MRRRTWKVRLAVCSGHLALWPGRPVLSCALLMARHTEGRAPELMHAPLHPATAVAEAKAERAKRIAERLERAPKTLDEGGGMFFYERAWFAVRGLVNRATAALKPSAA